MLFGVKIFGKLHCLDTRQKRKKNAIKKIIFKRTRKQTHFSVCLAKQANTKKDRCKKKKIRIRKNLITLDF